MTDMRKLIKLITETFKPVITEVFDSNSEIVNWNTKNTKAWKGEFEVNGLPYGVQFTLSDGKTGLWNVALGKQDASYFKDPTYAKVQKVMSKEIHDDFPKGKVSSALPVFVTAFSAVEQFLKEVGPNTLTFYAPNESRTKLYRAVLYRNKAAIIALGYHLTMEKGRFWLHKDL